MDKGKYGQHHKLINQNINKYVKFKYQPLNLVREANTVTTHKQISQ